LVVKNSSSLRVNIGLVRKVATNARVRSGASSAASMAGPLPKEWPTSTTLGSFRLSNAPTQRRRRAII